jgi:hypothetical protein
VIAGLKEIVAKPDPRLGYYNGELRWWLGWAQDVAGDHVAARQSWQQALSELEPFLKEQPDNNAVIEDVALAICFLVTEPKCSPLQNEPSPPSQSRKTR